MIEHKLRLENGSRVFTDIKSEIANLRGEIRDVVKQSAPKPMDWWRAVGYAAGVLVTILTAWWALSQQLADRPTMDQIDKVMKAHVDTGHPTIANEIKAVHDEQITQRDGIKSITDKVEATQQDVKDIKADIRAMRGQQPPLRP